MKAIGNILHCPNCDDEWSLNLKSPTVKTKVGDGLFIVFIKMKCDSCDEDVEITLYQSKDKSIRTPVFIEWLNGVSK